MSNPTFWVETIKNNNSPKHLLKLENNRKLRSTFELLIENPNIKSVQEKPIAIKWINPDSNSLSDTTDATDTAKNKIDCNIDNNGVSISSAGQTGQIRPQQKITMGWKTK